MTLRQVVLTGHSGAEVPRALRHRVNSTYSQLALEQLSWVGRNPAYGTCILLKSRRVW